MTHAIRLSANLGFLWTELPLLERITSAAKAGFGGIELHAPDASATDVARLCQDYSLKLLSVNTPIGDSTQGDFGLAAQVDRIAEFRGVFTETLEWAATAGAQFIHVLPGKVVSHREAARECFIENLCWASELAESQRISLLLEAINGRDKPGYFYHTQEAADEIRQACGRDNIKLMFDVYHVAVSQGDVLTRLQRLMPHIGHIQVASVPSRDEPDQGEIRYEAVFECLSQQDYQGWIGCEYRPQGDLLAGLQRWTAACHVSLTTR